MGLTATLSLSFGPRVASAGPDTGGALANLDCRLASFLVPFPQQPPFQPLIGFFARERHHQGVFQSPAFFAPPVQLAAVGARIVGRWGIRIRRPEGPDASISSWRRSLGGSGAWRCSPGQRGEIDAASGPRPSPSRKVSAARLSPPESRPGGRRRPATKGIDVALAHYACLRVRSRWWEWADPLGSLALVLLRPPKEPLTPPPNGTGFPLSPPPSDIPSARSDCRVYSFPS